MAQAYEFKGKSPQELTQDDLDELAYIKGNYLVHIQTHQHAIDNSDAQLQLTRAKNKKKNRLSNYRQTVKDMKSEKQKIIDEALAPYREQLAELDGQIASMQEIIVTFTDNADNSITNLGVVFGDVKGRIEHYEEQVEMIDFIVAMQAEHVKREKKENPVVKLTDAQVKALQRLIQVDKKGKPGTLNAYALNWNVLVALNKRGLIILQTPDDERAAVMTKQTFRDYSYATITEEGREVIKDHE